MKNENLTDLERALRNIMQLHRGKTNTISRENLCRVFLTRPENDRWLRQTIKHLIIKHGCPVGSCPQGYFWAVTAKEIEEVCNYFRGYALSQLQVISRLKKKPLRIILGQLIFNKLDENP